MNEKQVLLEHLSNELNYMNRYQQELDSKHNIFFALGLGIFGAFLMIGTGGASQTKPATITVFAALLIVSVFTVLIYYAAYRLRMVAILRGRAKAIELQINNLIGYECYRWNSYYIQKYIHENNKANTFLFIPVVILFLLTAAMCWAAISLQDVPMGWKLFSYLFIILNVIGSVFAGIAIGKNNKMYNESANYDPFQEMR